MVTPGPNWVNYEHITGSKQLSAYISIGKYFELLENFTRIVSINASLSLTSQVSTFYKNEYVRVITTKKNKYG